MLGRWKSGNERERGRRDGEVVIVVEGVGVMVLDRQLRHIQNIDRLFRGTHPVSMFRHRSESVPMSYSKQNVRVSIVAVCVDGKMRSRVLPGEFLDWSYEDR